MSLMKNVLILGAVGIICSDAFSQLFTDISDTTGLENWPNFSDVYPIDWNDDGYIDFIGFDWSITSAGLYLNNGMGQFIQQNELLGSLNGPIDELCAGDLDNDGLLELVTVDGEQLSIHRIENGVAVHQLTLSDLSYGNLRLADIDVDGDLEIIVNIGANPDYISLIQVSSAFQISQQAIYIGYSARVGVTDIDNNGYVDVFTTRNEHTGPYGGYSIFPAALVMNDMGAFTPIEQVPGTVPHYWPSFFDYNNDGLFDVHIGSDDWISNGPEKVWLLENSGEFQFADVSQAGQYFGWNYYGHIEVVDAENDGDFDYFQQMGAWNGSRLIVNNNGDLATDTDFHFPGGNSNKGCGVFDFDNDGDLDVLFTEEHWVSPLSHFSFYRCNAQGNYLTVTPVKSNSALNTYGIRLLAWTGGRVIMPPMQDARYSFTRRFNFGLGDATQVDSLQIFWGGGMEEVYYNLPANQHITLLQESSNGAVEAGEIPTNFQLGDAFPNPFNPVTTIPFELGETSHIRLAVIDLAGREVALLRDGLAEQGQHQLQFDGSALASGMYLLRLEAGEVCVMKKLLLVK